MSDDTKKDLVEVGTAVAMVAVGAAALPAAALPVLVGTAWLHYQERRTSAWWGRIADRSTNHAELEQKMYAGLLADDASTIAGIVDGARAAIAAVDLATVPVIAELSRLHLQEGLPRWIYRGALELVERLDATQLAALRTLLSDIDAVPEAESVTAIAGHGAKEWSAFPTEAPEKHRPLTPSPNAVRLFSALKRAELAHNSGGFGIAGSPNAVVIDRAVVGWLLRALRDD